MVELLRGRVEADPLAELEQRLARFEELVDRASVFVPAQQPQVGTQSST